MKLMIAAVLAALPLSALAEAPGIAVTDAYARSSNPQTGAAFMTIANHNGSDCVLRGASSPAAERVELHTHKDDGGVMKMMAVADMPVPAGATRALQRGGDHVMFMGLKKPLKDGDIVETKLDFGDCGMLELNIKVDNARTPAPGAAMGHGQMKGHAGQMPPASN